MNVFKKIAIVFVLIIVVLTVFVIVKSIAHNEKTDIKEKTLSELKYFESKIVSMFNLLNNIEFENYQISISDISEKSKKSPDNEEKGKEKSNEDSSNSEDEGKGSGGDNQNSEEKSASEGESSSNEQQEKKYSLNFKGVLAENGQIKWETIKTDAEILENSISSLMLDLYELSLNNAKIIEFTQEYDYLLVSIKNEDKEKALLSLNKIYSYIPDFLKCCCDNNQYETVIGTKQKILSAYSILDMNNWEDIEKLIDEAIEEYSKLINVTVDDNNNNMNQYIINKCYITLNGLKNACRIKKKEIFLIKYKNILEDFNSL